LSGVSTEVKADSTVFLLNNYLIVKAFFKFIFQISVFFSSTKLNAITKAVGGKKMRQQLVRLLYGVSISEDLDSGNVELAERLILDAVLNGFKLRGQGSGYSMITIPLLNADYC